MRLWSIVALLVVVITGCEGQISNTSPNATTGRGIVYPISAPEADQILSQAMVATFPGTPISVVALPNKGYTATMRILLDSHQITAMAVPAAGQEPGGSKVSGYSFLVSHAGTIPITGGNRAASLFETINQQATAIRPPLPAASN